jgi:uncharacterized protein YjgD (DUF1641 family)
MAEKNIQEQITEVNRKLDHVMEFIEQQNRKREEFDDLVEDVSIVAKDAVRNTVLMLDKSQVELDTCGLSCLFIKVMQNIGTFHEMLEMMESARDFIKDVTPVLHQVGLDAVNKMNEFDQKGYFEYLSALGKFVDKWVQTFTVEDINRLESNMDHVAGILRNLSDTDFLAGLSRTTKAITRVKMDDTLDNKSLWKIFLQMKSPEVRKSISYSLRLLQEINKNIGNPVTPLKN